jgi:hypothetical protein
MSRTLLAIAASFAITFAAEAGFQPAQCKNDRAKVVSVEHFSRH